MHEFTTRRGAFILTRRHKNEQNEDNWNDISEEQIEEEDSRECLFSVGVSSPPVVDDFSNSHVINYLQNDAKEGNDDEKANLGGLSLEEIRNELHFAERAGNANAKQDRSSQDHQCRCQNPPRFPQTEVLLVELDILSRNSNRRVTVGVKITPHHSKQNRCSKRHSSTQNRMSEPQNILRLPQLQVLASCKYIRPVSNKALVPKNGMHHGRDSPPTIKPMAKTIDSVRNQIEEA